MKIKRIISGGQTGADRGGLDAAIELNIEHGGWCPKGRTAENGIVPLRYKLDEAPVTGYPARTKLNVRHSDATAIFTLGSLGRGSTLTINCCLNLRRSFKRIDLEVGLDEAAAQLREWLAGVEGGTLNVAGSRESTSPGIQEMVRQVLVTALSRR